MGEKKQCAFIKETNGKRCKNNARDGSDYCWVHEGGVPSSEEFNEKVSQNVDRRGSKNPNFKHGLHANVLKMMCTQRCFMYDECEFRTDTDEGKEMFGGICFFETDMDNPEEDLLRRDGLKKFLIRVLKLLETRIARGLRYELATGGFLSEMEVSVMFRTVSNLGFNLMQIYEQEEMDDLREALEATKDAFEKAKKKVEL